MGAGSARRQSGGSKDMRTLKTVRPGPSRGDGRKGQSMIEFALCFLLFLSVTLGFGQIAMVVWVKTTMRHAVREGVRFAVTGRTIDGLGHDASIREVVRRNTAGFLTPANVGSLVTIEYYDAVGAASALNEGGNTIVLAVKDYPVPNLAPQLLSQVPLPLKVTAEATDTLEAFPTPPTR